MNSTEIYSLLAAKFCPPSYVLMSEVRDGTGYAKEGRSMDALAFGLWPSRGLELVGFEIKVSRSDWMREIKQPEKAEAFHKYLDRWYIAAAPGVVDPASLPVGWGLLEARGDKLKTMVEATPKKAKPIDRLFLMSIVRNFDRNYVAKKSFDDKVAIDVAARLKDAVSGEEYRSRNLRETHEQLVKQVREFESASGVRISDRWGDDTAKIGAAVKLVLETGEDKVREATKYALGNLKRIVESIEKSLEREEPCQPTVSS